MAFANDVHLDCEAEPYPFGTIEEPTTERRHLELVLTGDCEDDIFKLGEILVTERDTIRQLYLDKLPEKKNFFPGSKKSTNLTVDVTLKVLLEPGNDEKAIGMATFEDYLNQIGNEESNSNTKTIILLCVVTSDFQAISQAFNIWLPKLCKPKLLKFPLMIIGINSNSLEKHDSFHIEKAKCLVSIMAASSYEEISLSSPDSITKNLPDIRRSIVKTLFVNKKKRRESSSKRMLSLTSHSAYCGKKLKIVLIGDADSGKYCLVRRFIDGRFADSKRESVTFGGLDSVVHLVSIGNDQISDIPVSLWLTSGERGLNEMNTLPSNARLRALSYPDADVILICFSSNDELAVSKLPDRMNEIRWHERNQNIKAGTPVLLVETKCDKPNVKPCPQCMVSRNSGKCPLLEMTGAAGHFQCSATTGFGVDQVFEEAVGLVFKSEKYHKNNCSIM